MKTNTVYERGGYFWHWQNLKKEEKDRHWVNGRAWLHRRRSGIFGVQWCIPGFRFSISMTVGGMENQLSFVLALVLFALYFHVEGLPFLNKWRVMKGYHAKRTGIDIHNWALWWNCWQDEDEWRSNDPKWRRYTFHIDDFFLGRNKYSIAEEEPIPAVMHMPEGDYPVTVKFMTRIWKRPRWPFALVRRGADVDSEMGIPTPGKGENSWDCDDDAFMSIGTSGATVEEAIAQATQSVMQRRERYGGKNWTTERKPA